MGQGWDWTGRLGPDPLWKFCEDSGRIKVLSEDTVIVVSYCQHLYLMLQGWERGRTEWRHIAHTEVKTEK